MANPQLVVVVEGHGTVFGPFATRVEADRFARFISDEVDPAQVRALCSPVVELLNWRDHQQADGNCPLCGAALNRDGSCGKSCAGVGDG
jgi:hypothetical protein